jgi:hypothetical protein
MAGSVVEWNSRHPQIRGFNHDHTSKLFRVRHHRPDSKIRCRVPQAGRQLLIVPYWEKWRLVLEEFEEETRPEEGMDFSSPQKDSVRVTSHVLTETILSRRARGYNINGQNPIRMAEIGTH